MKTTILIMLVCLSHSAMAETYKCVQSGETIYSSSPCGDNAQVVANHIMTIDALPRENIQEQNSDQTAPVEPAAPTERSAVVPAQAAAAPAITCTSEEAAFEAVKKAIRAGYPASLSNYWHDRFVQTRDAYDLCREKLQKSMAKK
jgi:hypothetical protein